MTAALISGVADTDASANVGDECCGEKQASNGCESGGCGRKLTPMHEVVDKNAETRHG
jgi:hypothetical protein